MDPQADSDEEFVVLSTSDYTESASYAFAELFVKSIGFLPSLLGARVTEFQGSGTSRTHIQKYSETIKRQIVDQRSITNYNCVINGGRGGSGGEGGDKGGDGGTGQGPTIYLGQSQAQEPSEFRTIPRGDVKLVKEVRLSPQSGIVGRQSRGVGVRRTVYHAEIRGDPGTVTVAMYQGDGAEEEWRKDVAKYESIWDPRIVQLCGLEVTNYIDNVIGSSMETSVWIRSSTGQLCLDLAQGEAEMGSRPPWWNANILRLENLSLSAPNSEDMIISSLSEDQYYELCSQPLIAQFQYFQVSTEHPVGAGIFQLDSQCGTCVRITEPPNILLVEELHWENYGRAPDELLPNSWIWYHSHRTRALKLGLELLSPSYEINKAWLAQANYIFVELDKETHVEDFVCICDVEFTLRITDKHDIPEGYLFVCPPEDFCTGTEPHAALYQWPACPAYWSLDSSGIDRLSTEDARNLGFPAIHIETRMYGASWDHSVYEGLRRFHEGKGHNPNSREVARRLRYTLYKVLRDVDSGGLGALFPARKDNDWCEQLCREFGHYL
ncbi:Kinase-like protein [Mycena sanguinolenta]|uniref:Kinase-like protein n=1 Tax=Mycena sanguinolenta TaxID=230812 RepID=A0A8H7CWS5_9AGAR|nr:Kinase-like protein [Mycena sanguinolenta]